MAQRVLETSTADVYRPWRAGGDGSADRHDPRSAGLDYKNAGPRGDGRPRLRRSNPVGVATPLTMKLPPQDAWGKSGQTEGPEASMALFGMLDGDDDSTP